MGNGKMVRSVVVANRYGETAQSTKATSKTIWPTAAAGSSTPVETSTKAIGSTTRHRAREFIYTQMAPCTPASG